MANNINTNSEQSYASWQEGVADSLSDKLEISYNDAQGIIDASEFYMAQAWGKGMNEEQTADFIDKKSRSMANGGGVGNSVTQKEYLNYLTDISLEMDIANENLIKYLKSKGVSNIGLLPNEIKNDSKYKELKRKFEAIKGKVSSKVNPKLSASTDRMVRMAALQEYKKILADEISKQDKMAKGGGVGKENFDMVKSQNKAISHHTKELNTQLNKGKNTPAWVVSKVSRASNDLSDVTHYLDGETMADGGGVEKVGKVMHEYKEGNLHSGRTGKVVTDRKQAIAIALSEAGLSKKMVNGGGVGEENEVLSFFNNIDYSKLPPAFGEYIRKEVLTDEDLQFLSPREPIFLEIKSKVEGYTNKGTTSTTTGDSEEKKKVMKEIADLEGIKDLVSGDELTKINKELDDLNGLLPIL